MIRAAKGGEHDFEAVRGLPGALPQGERIVWQGPPGGRGWRATPSTSVR